jgi:AhpD family alkylhydroperoxidase
MTTTILCVLGLMAPNAALGRSPQAQAALNDIDKTLGFVPTFLKALPDAALPGAWMEMKDLEMSPSTALPPRYKELIGLAVAATIPCRYCIAAHTEFAKADGATPDELGVAIAAAGLTRHWSTFINGVPLDDGPFRTDLDKMIDRMTAKDANEERAKSTPVKDPDAALQDIENRIGFVPNFFKLFPPNALAGVWTEYRDLELDQHAMPAQYVDLIGLAVGAQIPCRYCVESQTTLAKAHGATEAQISEAAAMAAHTRNFSTLLNGLQIDEAAFRLDLRRLTTRKPKTASR